MKKNLLLFTFTAAFFFLSSFIFAQGTWSQKANYGGSPTAYAIGFSTNGKGYVGIGDEGILNQKFWEWDKSSNTWFQRAVFTGTARLYAASFSIGNNGYVGTGWDGTMRKDFWEYNDFNNVWTQKADFGGTARRNAVGFAVGAKGYIGTGYDGAYKQDIWEYNPITNTWVQKANFAGPARGSAVAMTISGKGYLGTGMDASISYADFWEYNSITDVWTAKANFTGAARSSAVAFSVGTRGYIGTGVSGTTHYQDFYQYESGSNLWTSVNSLPGASRKGAIAFSTGGQGYVATGLDNSSNYLGDLWEFTPACNLTLSVTVTNATCGNANGTATVVATNGAGPYTYQWTNGDKGVIADSLVSGLYQILVTDATGCTKHSTALISDAGSPAISTASVVPASCKGYNNGSININVTGGSTPYTYLWVNGATTQDITNLTAGPYQVQVTGANGCMAMSNIIVTEPAQLTVSVSINNASCGSSNGTATAIPSGGSAPYTYMWWITPAQTTATATGLAAGGYSVTLTDVKGCSTQGMAPIINVGGAVIVLDSVKAASCVTKQGSIYLGVSGGAPPYVYAWSNGATTQDLVNVPSGPYSLVVTGGNSCTGAFMGVVPKALPAAPSICQVTVDTIQPKNICVFKKDSVQNPGLSHYNFYRESIVAGQYQLLGSRAATLPSEWTDQSANPLQHAWRYKVSAVDTCGNESVLSSYHKTMHLSANIGLNNNVNLIWDDYEGFAYSTFIIYRFTWPTGWDSINSVSGNIHAYTDIAPPTLIDLYYYVAVENPSGCEASSIEPQPETSNLNLSKSNINKINPGPTGVHPTYTTGAAVQVFPNPTQGEFKVQSTLFKAGTVEIFDVMGRPVFSKNFDQGMLNMDLSQEPSGIYFIKVKTEGGSVTKKIVVQK